MKIALRYTTMEPCPAKLKRNFNLRRFPAIPRATKMFERLYKGRTAVERVNARLKVLWGVDDGNITGARRFLAEVGAVMVVHATLASLLAMAPRREGTLGKLRLSPIAQALRERFYGQRVSLKTSPSRHAAAKTPSQTTDISETPLLPNLV